MKDLADEIVRASFYEQELQKVHVKHPDDIEYKINKVLSTKTFSGKKYSLVNWYGYSDKFNTYIPTANIKAYAGKS